MALDDFLTAFGHFTPITIEPMTRPMTDTPDISREAVEKYIAGWSDDAPYGKALLRALRDEVDRLEGARNLSYGLLWQMRIDRNIPNLRLASDARKTLLDTMTKDDQAKGITAARALQHKE